MGRNAPKQAEQEVTRRMDWAEFLHFTQKTSKGKNNTMAIAKVRENESLFSERICYLESEGEVNTWIGKQGQANKSSKQKLSLCLKNSTQISSQIKALALILVLPLPSLNCKGRKKKNQIPHGSHLASFSSLPHFQHNMILRINGIQSTVCIAHKDSHFCYRNPGRLL